MNMVVNQHSLGSTLRLPPAGSLWFLDFQSNIYWEGGVQVALATVLSDDWAGDYAPFNPAINIVANEGLRGAETDGYNTAVNLVGDALADVLAGATFVIEYDRFEDAMLPEAIAQIDLSSAGFIEQVTVEHEARWGRMKDYQGNENLTTPGNINGANKFAATIGPTRLAMSANGSPAEVIDPTAVTGAFDKAVIIAYRQTCTIRTVAIFAMQADAALDELSALS